LVDYLGKVDAAIEIAHVALHNLEVVCLAQASPSAHLDALARSAGIYVHANALGSARKTLVESNIVLVHGCVEQFTADLTSESKEVLGWKLGREASPEGAEKCRDDEASLTAIVRQLRKRATWVDDEKATTALSMLDYYRLVRNAVAHAPAESRLALRHRANEDLCRMHFGWVPSAADDLQLGDFFAQTTAAKYVANWLNVVAGPADQDLRRLVSQLISERLSAHRPMQHACGVLHTRYGIDVAKLKEVASKSAV
jgi:hypothetical protein